MSNLYKSFFYNSIMKNKNNSILDLSFLNFVKSIFNFKTFSENNLNQKNLLFYILVGFIDVFLIGLLKSVVVNDLNFFELILSLFVILPFSILIFFSIFYIILNAFTDIRKPFFESLFVFISIIIPFIIIGNLLTLIIFSITNILLMNLLSFLIGFLLIYLLINFSLNFKNYYGISIYKIITSLILVEIIIGIVAILEYLSILVN